MIQEVSEVVVGVGGGPVDSSHGVYELNHR